MPNEATPAENTTPSIAELRTMLSGGAETTKEAPAAPASGDNAAAGDQNARPASEPGDKETARDEHGRFTKPAEGGEAKPDEKPGDSSNDKPGDKPADKPDQDSVDRRIGKAVAKQRDAERRVQELEAENRRLRGLGEDGKPKDDPEPKSTDFTDYAEYDRKLKEWEFRQFRRNENGEALTEASKAVDQARGEVFAERFQATAKEIPDFHKTLEGIKDVPVTEVVQAAIMSSDQGPRIMYELAKHPDEARRIAAIADPVLVGREIGRIEARLEQSSTTPTPRKVSQAPAPPSTVGSGSAHADINLNDPKMPLKDFKAAAAKALRK